MLRERCSPPGMAHVKELFALYRNVSEEQLFDNLVYFLKAIMPVCDEYDVNMEYTLNDLVKINVAKVFEVAFDEMMAQDAQPSTQNLWERFEKHLSRAVDTTAAGIQFHLTWQDQNEPELICNLLSQGPVETGLDVTKSARYFNMR